VPVLLHHYFWPEKYRKVVFSKAVNMTMKEICLDTEKRFEVHFLEIRNDKNHVHFLVQSVPRIIASEIIMMIKSITVGLGFKKHPEV
jgi:REP element-mobilizing transposase RayT